MIFNFSIFYLKGEDMATEEQQSILQLIEQINSLNVDRTALAQAFVKMMKVFKTDDITKIGDLWSKITAAIPQNAEFFRTVGNLDKIAQLDIAYDSSLPEIKTMFDVLCSLKLVNPLHEGDDLSERETRVANFIMGAVRRFISSVTSAYRASIDRIFESKGFNQPYDFLHTLYQSLDKADEEQYKKRKNKLIDEMVRVLREERVLMEDAADCLCESAVLDIDAINDDQVSKIGARLKELFDLYKISLRCEGLDVVILTLKNYASEKNKPELLEQVAKLENAAADCFSNDALAAINVLENSMLNIHGLMTKKPSVNRASFETYNDFPDEKKDVFWRTFGAAISNIQLIAVNKVLQRCGLQDDKSFATKSLQTSFVDILQKQKPEVRESMGRAAQFLLKSKSVSIQTSTRTLWKDDPKQVRVKIKILIEVMKSYLSGVSSGLAIGQYIQDVWAKQRQVSTFEKIVLWLRGQGWQWGIKARAREVIKKIEMTPQPLSLDALPTANKEKGEGDSEIRTGLGLGRNDSAAAIPKMEERQQQLTKDPQRDLRLPSGHGTGDDRQRIPETKI